MRSCSDDDQGLWELSVKRSPYCIDFSAKKRERSERVPLRSRYAICHEARATRSSYSVAARDVTTSGKLHRLQPRKAAGASHALKIHRRRIVTQDTLSLAPSSAVVLLTSIDSLLTETCQNNVAVAVDRSHTKTLLHRDTTQLMTSSASSWRASERLVDSERHFENRS